MRLSAACAALRSTRLLLQVFRANYFWDMGARAAPDLTGTKTATANPQRNDGPWNPIYIARCSATLAPSRFEKRSNGDSSTVKSTNSFSPTISRAT